MWLTKLQILHKINVMHGQAIIIMVSQPKLFFLNQNKCPKMFLIISVIEISKNFKLHSLNLKLS